MIYSYEIEKQVLAAFLQKPNVFVNYLNVLSEKDFYDKNSLLHKTLFIVLKKSLEKNESIDDIVIYQRIKDLGIKFEENIDLLDYIRSLSIRKVNSDERIESSIKELKKLSVRREISATGKQIADKMKNLDTDVPYLQIVELADKLYNDKINLFEVGDDVPQNIYDEMENFI